MIFNSSEVFQIGAQIERNGQKFYRKAAEITSDPKIIELLESLAEMEDNHEELFIRLHKELVEIPQSEFPDMDDQLTQYLHSFADKEVFKASETPASKINKNTSLEEIFDIAIDFERSSVVFFTLIKEMVPESLGKDKIDILIKEEIMHIAELNNQLNALKK